MATASRWRTWCRWRMSRGRTWRESRIDAAASPWAYPAWNRYDHKPDRRAGDVAGQWARVPEILPGVLQYGTAHRSVRRRYRRCAVGVARSHQRRRCDCRHTDERIRLARSGPDRPDDGGA